MGRRQQQFNAAHQHSVEAPQEEGSKKFKPRSAMQRHAVRSIKENDITLLLGPAGTGKTLLSIWASYLMLRDKECPVEKIVIVRLAAETCGENIGALPGEIEDKLGHLAAPIVDNLGLFCKRGEIEYLIEQKKIEVVPVSHARGRSFMNAVILIEEIQNLTFDMVLTLLTRLGPGSKLVLNGDPAQVDIPGRNGVHHAKALLEGLDGVGYFEFTTQDIERHPLVRAIVERSQQISADHSKVRYIRTNSWDQTIPSSLAWSD